MARPRSQVHHLARLARTAAEATLLGLGFYAARPRQPQHVITQECKPTAAVHSRGGSAVPAAGVAVAIAGAEVPPCPNDPSRVVWYWRDWLYVGRPQAFAALAAMVDSPIVANATLRCAGLCPEEQSLLQLARRHVTLAPLSADWHVRLVRAPCSTIIRPALSRAEPPGNTPCAICAGEAHSKRKGATGVLG